MESYRETYNHRINLIPGQPLWEQAENCNRPYAPKIKTKHGKLKMKWRMDADEKSCFGTKKPKIDPKLLSNTGDGVHLKRQLGIFTCSFCGKKGHTKRDCEKKRDVNAAIAAVEAAEKKKKDKGHPAPEQQVEQPQDDGGHADVESNPVEIEISQPITSEEEDSQKAFEAVTKKKILFVGNLTNSEPLAGCIFSNSNKVRQLDEVPQR
ncbi:hypothetical protein Ahy_A03g014685 [Arachis hypogaea]|uniref:CCHC-type domain-containing protein n=1 Tax=Arachis hypogaea TaxID=3818 RepID=A0A445DYD1_ARAHY|nr:hypothetical protein Ahy_A03g014685 [Arachis hypogaea]